MLYEIEIRRRKFFQPAAKIAHDRNSLQENLWQDDCRTHIQIHAAAIERPSHRTKQPEIVIGGCAERFSGCLRVRMNDVGADSNMNRDGHFELVRFGKNAYSSVLEGDSSAVAFDYKSA